MSGIIIALVSVACMTGLWLVAWALWQLFPAAPPPAVAPREIPPERSTFREPSAPELGDYAKDKAKTAFFVRRP